MWNISDDRMQKTSGYCNGHRHYMNTNYWFNLGCGVREVGGQCLKSVAPDLRLRVIRHNPPTPVLLKHVGWNPLAYSGFHWKLLFFHWFKLVFAGFQLFLGGFHWFPVVSRWLPLISGRLSVVSTGFHWFWCFPLISFGITCFSQRVSVTPPGGYPPENWWPTFW